MKSISLLLATVICLTTHAARHQLNGGEVLEKFPPGFTARASRLRATINSQRSDADVIRLAQDYAWEGRAWADPRSIRVAASLLEPLVARTNPAPEALLTYARLKSYEHDFDAAIQLLDRAIIANSSSAEALLQKVSLLTTLGRFEDARRIFGANPALLAESRGIVLLTQLSSLTGQLEASYALLQHHIERSTNLSCEEKIWTFGILAEMAERIGNSAAAEAHYRKALASLGTGVDIFLSNAWLDFLIDQKRHQEATVFATTSPLRDNLLLRRVIAAAALQEARTLEEQLFQSATHEREQCLFLLRVKRDAPAALRAALQNWQTQKEPIDVRLVLESASAAHNVHAAEPVFAWINANRYQDARLAPFVREESL